MGDGEVLPWLKALPLAPEYRPTEAEFADPIAYILKIEKEACQYGICKIIPPIPKAPKKVVIANLNRCLGKLQSNNNSSSDTVAVAAGAPLNVNGSNAYTEFCKGTNVAKFTTRQQQIGWSPKKARGGPLQTVVQKSVWESGDTYTLEQFEAKAKMFARSRLKSSRDVAPLVAETLFWRATADKPFTVEYANDIPGTAFGEPDEKFLSASTAPQQRKMQSQRKRKQKEGSQNSCLDLSNTAWNMRIASRSHGSLLRYMPDEVPGVTSPMVYIAMLFSWFAWHVEDHDLHSLNYLHMGASKTWYAVPGDAAPAFEEVIRRDGYGGHVNPIVALGMLAEKTTVMSPEVLIAAGVPCCRLVQNAGEFVVTFPRAYHLGFSHGFNCGEAANLATPDWLKVAKEAAVRRAAMEYLPMLSHQQLLYFLAMDFNSRIPEDVASQPRSHRLKYRQKGEGEMVLKRSFVNDVIENNQLLSILLQKSSTRHAIVWNSANVSCDLPSSPLCFSTPETKYNATSSDVSRLKVLALQSDTLVNVSTAPGRNEDMFIESSSKIVEDASITAGIGVSLSNNDKNKNLLFYNNSRFPSSCTDNIHIQRQAFKRGTSSTNMDRDSGSLACIACGVLGFASMVVIQPCQEAARKLLPSYNKLDQKYLETFGTGSVSCDVACGGITATYSQSPIIDEKMGMDIENVQLDNHGAALASTAKIMAYTNLSDEEGHKHNLVDFPNLSIMKNNLAADLCMNNLSNNIMASWQLRAKENNAVVCSTNAFVTCEDNACEGHSKYLSSAICLENSPGTYNEKNTHAYGVVAENINSVDIGHSESKKWKESPNLSTLNDANMPNSFSVCSASGMPQVSSLDLLAVTYGDSVDSDEDDDASQAAKKDFLCGLPNSARTCENGHKLSGIADATGTDVCAQCLSGHLSSSTLVAKIKTEETHDDPISAGTESEYRSSFLYTGPKDSLNISMGKNKDNMGEMSNNTPNQSPKRNITCHTSVADCQKSSHEELNVCETQISVILERNQKQKGILTPPVCEASSNTLSKIDKNLKETSGSNALPSNQCGYIDMKVSEDSKDLTGSINYSTGENECKLVSTEACANKSILEGKVVSTSFTTPSEVLGSEVGKSDIDAHRFSEAFPASDHHSGILVRLGDELKESNVSDKGNTYYLSVRKNKTQTCHLAGNTMGGFTKTDSLKGNIEDTPIESTNAASLWKPSKGFLRPQVFCLQHAIEIEQQLQSIGGAHMLLLCHSNYPSIEKKARSLASEIGNNYLWKDIPLRDAATEDLEVIHSAIDDEGGYELASTDWTVCLDMSLHHSINLSKSPLYSKQIPYNPVLNALFFSSSLDNCSPNSAYGSERQYDSTKQRKKSKHKKITVAGKWCGRVWMVNQVHPYLASDKFQPSASFGTIKTRKLEDEVSQEQGHPWKHMIEEADCKPIVKPKSTMIPDEQILMPLLGAPDAMTPDEQISIPLSGGPDAMISDEQISKPLLGGPDIEQVSSANLRAIAEESSACQEGGQPQQYTTVQNTDYKPELEKRTTFSRNEHCLITYTKNTQKVSVSRKLTMKRKFHSGQTFDINKKVKLLECTTLDSDGRTPLPSSPINVQGDSMMVSDEGFSAYSKGELAAKPTASCLAGEKPKHKVVDKDYAQDKADHTQEKMVEVDIEIQYTHGTNAQNKGCISQWTRNRNLLDSCDTLEKKETKCSVRSKRNIGLKDGNKVHSAEGSHVSTSENTVVSKSQIVSQNSSPTGELEGGPSTRLRSRSLRDRVEVVSKVAEKALLPQPASTKKISRGQKKTKTAPSKNADKKNGYQCDTEGCTMNFTTKQDLQLHKRNTCPIKGCGKHFISHKYLLHHRRVHLDDRPLTCPWKGCGKTFKWAWARTEHVRVHTKERPYICKTAGCGKTFRFVSDFSRHKRKTGHPKQ